MKGDCTPRGFEQVGKIVFCGKANRSKKEQGEPKAEQGLEDNATVLYAIKKWVGQGGKASLATAPDADILQEIVCLLTQCVRAGRATS
jgi:hypothetical protein